MAVLTIANQSDAEAALRGLLDGDLGDDVTVHFDGWPTLHLTVRGESYHGGVPTRVMPAFLRLQRMLDEQYVLVKYGDDRKIPKEERHLTEVVVYLEAGRSTTFSTALAKQLNTLGMQAIKKMESKHLMIVLVAAAISLAGAFSWKFYVESQAQQHGRDLDLAISKEETARFEILAKAADRTPMVREIIEAQKPVQAEFIKRLAPGDVLTVGDEQIIDGETGRQIIRQPRTAPVEARLDGSFMIVSVDSGLISGGYKIKVRNVATRDELSVYVPAGTLTAEQIETLQRGEWGKKPLNMKLNTRKSGGRIVDATLVEAGLN